MFKAVCKMNEAYGNAAGNPLAPNWERLKSQAKNILDEYNELMDDGIEPKNMKEVRDAICDILVFTFGLAHMAGVPVEEDMDMVWQSNMSKFCTDEDDLTETLIKYRDLGVDVYVDGEFPNKRVKSSKYQVGLDGKEYQAHKMLKSVSFKEPVFRPL